MKLIICILILALQAAPALALQQEGNTIVLTDAEVAKCKSEGGCYFVTNDQLEKGIEAAVAEGARLGVASRGSRI